MPESCSPACPEILELRSTVRELKEMFVDPDNGNGVLADLREILRKTEQLQAEIFGLRGLIDAHEERLAQMENRANTTQVELVRAVTSEFIARGGSHREIAALNWKNVWDLALKFGGALAAALALYLGVTKR